ARHPPAARRSQRSGPGATCEDEQTADGLDLWVAPCSERRGLVADAAASAGAGPGAGRAWRRGERSGPGAHPVPEVVDAELHDIGELPEPRVRLRRVLAAYVGVV